MSIYVELLLIAAVVVYIVDLSGWTGSWKPALQRWVKSQTGYAVEHFKPFDCSLCLTWWAGLVWLLCRGAFGLGTLAYLCAVSWATGPLALAGSLCREALERMITKLMELIERI